MNRIERYYDAKPEDEWRRLAEHRVEYAVTLKALEEHFPPPPAAIIDIGGGAGRYAIELTRRGYAVTLTDLSAKCLELAQHKADEAGVGLAACVHADGTDLSRFPDAGFDAALLMGPLYHLLSHQERLLSVREAWRVLRPGGVVAAAFIGRYSAMHYGIAHWPEYIVERRDELESILATGVFRQLPDTEGFIDAWFAHPTEIPPLMAEGGFEPRALLHCESLASELEGKLNAAPDEVHRQWIDLLYRIAADPAVLGIGGHLLYIGAKKALPSRGPE